MSTALNTMTELCQELRNWFDRARVPGTYTITDGTITADFLVSGQYFRIIRSRFNDGVHIYGEDELTDETFEGSVWPMAVPPPVINLATEIAAWRTQYETVGSAAMSPFQSESFGEYSYSKSSGGSSSSGSSATPSWKSVFAARLNMWRKL